jgi:CysZ protein
MRLLSRPGIRPFVVAPVLVNLLLFVALTFFMVNRFDAVTDWMVDQWGEWLNWILWLLWLVVGLVWLALYGYLFATVSYLIAAPFYGLLAERVQLHLRGETPEQAFTFKQVARIAGRSFLREWRKMRYLIPRLLGVLVLCLILTFIPAVNLLVPPLWFAWGAWALAIENIDYAADNNQVPFDRLRDQARRNRFATLGFGGVALFAASIPLFNLIGIPAAVAGGSALWLDRFREPAAGER